MKQRKKISEYEEIKLKLFLFLCRTQLKEKIPIVQSLNSKLFLSVIITGGFAGWEIV